jgi:hypothetical protein
MAEVVYILCVITSLACAVLLLRGHRDSRSRLLFWSSLCFVGLALNNALLLVDLLVGPAIDLRLPRTGVAVLALAMLIHGLVGESR